jgi:Protein of unknown function (DUF2889)
MTGVISSPFLRGRDRYERRMEGWVDALPADALTHTVRITDEDAAVELAAVCTPSPGYEVREARAAVLAGAIHPDVAAVFAELAGARMVGGFTRRLLDLAADRPGGGLFVDAGVEVARLARQVARMPRERVAALRPGDARAYWALDNEGWVDLPNSCFTYGAGGRALLAVRTVTPAAHPDLYSPPADARGVFRRRKHARLVRTGRRLELFHSMHDDIHGFDIHLEVDLGRGIVVAADSVTSRLPYRGICDEPQRKFASLIGERMDAKLRKRIQTGLGGETGCGQLYDLTADLLKFLTLE